MAHTYVIPCGGAKLTHAAKARDLYVGTMFAHTLEAVLAAVDADAKDGIESRVLILSAKYGLVELDTVIEPYEQRMKARGSVSVATLAAQAQALGIDWDSQVYAYLPKDATRSPYFQRLDDALRSFDCYMSDVYEATAGIGEQKAVNCNVRKAAAMPVLAVTDAWLATWFASQERRAFSVVSFG